MLANNCRDRQPPASTVIGRKARESLEFIRNRFPHRSEIFSVLSAAAFFCHSWSLLGFFNKLSSFILRFSIAEIAEVFAFMMAFAFLESLAVTLLLVLLSAALPAAWLKDGFALKGFVFITVLAIASIGFQYFLTSDYPSAVLLIGTCILPLALIGLLIFLMRSHFRLQQVLSAAQDRLSIMVYIYGPLGLLSLLFVMAHYLI